MPRTHPTTWAHLQLHTLRTDYPGWDIVRCHEGDAEIWGALLRAPINDAMRSAGLVPIVRAPDCHTLAPALARQQAIVHTFRATTRTPPTERR
jgi:hypothetical protein